MVMVECTIFGVRENDINRRCRQRNGFSEFDISKKPRHIKKQVQLVLLRYKITNVGGI